jgi:hypothetical protein
MCETCSPPRAPRVAERAPVTFSGPGPLERVTVAELERVGTVGAIDAQALLTLARSCDRLPDGSARLGAVRALVQLKATDFAGAASAEPDRVDEIAAWRRAKLAGAASPKPI